MKPLETLFLVPRNNQMLSSRTLGEIVLYVALTQTKKKKTEFWLMSLGYFSKALMALEEPQGIDDMSRMKFYFQEYGVQIDNMPLLYMSESMGLQMRK